MNMNDYIIKAKTIDGNWVQGFYSRVTDNYTPKNIHYITTFEDLPNGETILKEMFEIDPETICRPSGFKDTNGNMIWEHDLVKDNDDNHTIAKIVYEKYQFGVHIVESDCCLINNLTFPLWQYDNCEFNGYRSLCIIGNEFDDYEKENEIIIDKEL